MNDQAPVHHRHRVGKWLPRDQEALKTWLAALDERVGARADDVKLDRVVEEFRKLIEDDPIVRMYITQMIEQVPEKKRHLRDIDHMLSSIDIILRTAPEYHPTALVGFPLNAILDECMGMPAGLAAFRNPTINAMFKRILTIWCEFLSSGDSLYVLNDKKEGWKSPDAQKKIQIELFQYDPTGEYWGFSSWNDFFTRRFKDSARPIADPDDDKIIVSACESTPYAISHNVKLHDKFWIKSQPYSLQDMLANYERAKEFDNGIVYQAFLNAYNYHRWHAPVGGTIEAAFVRDGTYYSEADSEREDPASPNNSQAYITHVATRALIFIRANDPTIGLMCVMPVGMAEVSSCVINENIKHGYKVKKGEELGYFQYGGSTHCLIFRHGAIAGFTPDAIPEPHNPDPPPVLLGAKIAFANPDKR